MSEKYLMDCWPGKMSLEDVSTWGICPIQKLNEIFDIHIFEEDEDWIFFHYELKSKLKNLEEVLHRFDIYNMLIRNRLKELVPDDPLLNDPEAAVRAELQKREESRKAHEAKKEAEKTETIAEKFDRLKVWAVLADSIGKDAQAAG